MLQTRHAGRRRARGPLFHARRPAGRSRDDGRAAPGEERRGAYVLERLELELNGLSPVPAYFARPLAFDPPYPTALYCHSHGGRYESGKEEFVAGQAYLRSRPTPRN